MAHANEAGTSKFLTLFECSKSVSLSELSQSALFLYKSGVLSSLSIRNFRSSLSTFTIRTLEPFETSLNLKVLRLLHLTD